jgi:hypothetical protein
MIQGILDEAYVGIVTGKIGAALTLVYGELKVLRERLHLQQWEQLTARVCLPHPLTDLIRQDPLISCGFRAVQTRGPLDKLLDYVYYRLPFDAPETSPLGREMFTYTVNTAFSRAIRCRRKYIGQLLDGIAEQVEQPRIAVLDPGFLREAELSFALATGQIGDFLAFGNDETALRRIERTYGNEGVRTRYGSPWAVARGEQTLAELGIGNLDLIYTSALLNRLAVPEATTLIEQMWQAVRPGGYLFLSNILTGLADAAFLDCYAGWRLQYRTRREVADLIRFIPPTSISAMTLDTDPDRAYAFLVLRKAG